MFAAIRALRYDPPCVVTSGVAERSLLQSNMRCVAVDDVVRRYNECSGETEVEISYGDRENMN